MASPATVPELGAVIRSAKAPVIARGGGSKPALSTAPSGSAGTVIETSQIAGITAYQPSEYTITALAGTPIAELQTTLAAEGQYLPFDPLLVASGATVGGTIAAGTSGPGRLRYGGVRDFLLEIVYLDGDGESVRGGGKVVKNAAGFDLPKLMVGALGSLGVLAEATFKVFPAPAASATLEIEAESLEQALALATRLLRSPLELSALDLLPPAQLSVRIAGTESALASRIQALTERIVETVPLAIIRWLQGSEEKELWRGRRELDWAPAGASLVKVPLTASAIPDLEQALEGTAPRLYSAGCQQLFLAWPGDLDLDHLLKGLHLSALVLRGETTKTRLGYRSTADLLEAKVRQALDPGNRFRRR